MFLYWKIKSKCFYFERKTFKIGLDGSILKQKHSDLFQIVFDSASSAKRGIPLAGMVFCKMQSMHLQLKQYSWRTPLPLLWSPYRTRLDQASCNPSLLHPMPTFTIPSSSGSSSAFVTRCFHPDALHLHMQPPDVPFIAFRLWTCRLPICASYVSDAADWPHLVVRGDPVSLLRC